MIINFPTALYDSDLPKETTDSQSVTFLISSEDPPRSTETLFQLLRSEELRPLPPKIFNPVERRVTLGDFVFNVSYGSQQKPGSGTKAYEVGQFLEFDDVAEPEDLVTLEVPKIVELQQNTNKLDLSALGLSAEEIVSLVSGATEQFTNLISQLNTLSAEIKNTESDIDANQKLINETKKASDAAAIVYADSTGSTEANDILDKLADKETELGIQRGELIVQLNDQRTQANEIYNEILELKEVVR